MKERPEDKVNNEIICIEVNIGKKDMESAIVSLEETECIIWRVYVPKSRKMEVKNYIECWATLSINVFKEYLVPNQWKMI